MGMGAAMLAAQAVKQMAGEMQRAIGSSMVRVRMGKPVVGDVPLLIRALEISDEATREDARMWLRKLAGLDCGPDADAWRAWWQAEGPRLERKEADERAAEALFGRLRNDLVLGRWDDVHATLARPLRIRVSPQLLAERLEERRRELRIAYRDATVTSTELGRSEGTLSVDWGERGFEIDSLRLVREDGEWRFGEAPWSDRLARREPGEPRLHYHAPERRPVRRRASSTQSVVIFFTLIGIIIAWPAAIALRTSSVLLIAPLLLLGPIIGLIIWTADRLGGGRRTGRTRRRAHGA